MDRDKPAKIKRNNALRKRKRKRVSPYVARDAIPVISKIDTREINMLFKKYLLRPLFHALT